MIPSSIAACPGVAAHLRTAVSGAVMAGALAAVLSERATAQSVAQDSAPAIAIVPQPESLIVARGEFKLTTSTVIWTDAASADLARRFAASLAPATGLTIPVRIGAAPATGIVLTRDARLTRLGAEGYELTVTPRRLAIRGRERTGVFYGLQTVRQLLPAEIFREAKVERIA